MTKTRMQAVSSFDSESFRELSVRILSSVVIGGFVIPPMRADTHRKYPRPKERKSLCRSCPQSRGNVA